MEVLCKFAGNNIVIGTHGTALALIINYYDKTFGFEKYMEMVELTPWCMHMCFYGLDFVSMQGIGFKSSRALRFEDVGVSYGKDKI